MFDRLIDPLIARLIDWLVHWLIDWSIGPLIDWLIDWSIDWSIDWLVHWLIDWLIGPLIGPLIDWLIDFGYSSYHQKYHLREHVEFYDSLGLSDAALVRSNVATRLHGYIYGYGSLADFEEEAKKWGLSEDQMSYVKKQMARPRKIHCGLWKTTSNQRFLSRSHVFLCHFHHTVQNGLDCAIIELHPATDKFKNFIPRSVLESFRFFSFFLGPVSVQFSLWMF